MNMVHRYIRPGNRPPALSPVEATLEATIAGDLPPPTASPNVKLVEGSSLRLSGETHTLLRRRLRAAALTLAVGFGLFFLRNVFIDDHPAAGYFRVYHGLIVVVLAVIAADLCKTRQKSTAALRLEELAVFGMPACFFFALEYFDLQHCVHDAYVESPIGFWATLVFTYALFIPNTWKRAACVIGVMVAAPIGLYATMWSISDEVAQRITFDDLSVIVLMLLIGAVAAVYGVYMIGQLRLEAFEAKQLGQYRLRHLIGSGGMGEVYLAEHQLMKRPAH